MRLLYGCLLLTTHVDSFYYPVSFIKHRSKHFAEMDLQHICGSF